MKTLSGYDAIEAAQPLRANLYDTDLRQELTVNEVLALLEKASRPVRAFTLPFWPETEDEADGVVLRAFRKHLSDTHEAEATLGELFPAAVTAGPIHPAAAHLAAQRLVEDGRLAPARAETGERAYRLLREYRFSDELVAALDGVVCDDCAHLELTGPFHEACLTNVVDFFQQREFTQSDLTPLDDADETANTRWVRAAGRTGTSVQRLAQSALSTGRKLQERLRAATGRGGSETPDDTANKPGARVSEHVFDADSRDDTRTPSPERAAAPGASFDSRQDGERDDDRSITPVERPTVTQDQLIRYLQSVEIVGSPNEAALRREYAQVLRRLAEKEQELEELRKQRSFVEQQFLELQRDMETVLEALQIARRRDPKPNRVIDADYD